MQQQSSALGPEVGWGVGLVGFAATAVIGWFMDAGVGFILVLLVFWGGIGGLFAFLVERSTIEEHDRVEELQNTRLATLGVAPRAAVAPEPVAVAAPAPAVAAPMAQAPPATAAPPARVVSSSKVAPSPRSYRERAGNADEPLDTDRAHRAAERDAERTERDRAAAAMLASAVQHAGAAARARERTEGGRGRSAPAPGSPPAPRSGPPAPRSGASAPRRPSPPAPPGAERPSPRSPREYREAKLEADARRDHAAA